MDMNKGARGVTTSLDMWVAFFHQIGPRLGARIQSLELFYIYPYGGTFDNETNDNERKANKSWTQLFENLSHAEVNPKDLILAFSSLRPFVDGHHSSFRIPAPVFKGLSYCFKKIQRFHVNGRIDPLWMYYLRRRYGFIVKRFRSVHSVMPYYSVWGNWEFWELINPEFFDPTMDLQHFSPSGLIEGIYDRDITN
ncbi:hypothetical protein F4821DRAFT_279742 [Hypoxylon rubiginosum]|uniref:Uncharacterized protein n=1 Tax=Hypoxylon rubiginosum TaxID=110542 RepID=A0ACC0CX91_9PEZI|nr:hypothetical protein F4821DRAFT_279742 [Hypoxylon rubiginosum]